MLFSPVYTEAHPRQNAVVGPWITLRGAADAPSSSALKSFNGDYALDTDADFM
jgi:hypothetical protein